MELMDDEGGTVTVRLVSDPKDWFTRRFRILFDAIIAQLPHALDPTQIEGIHDMRVATRRLRSALRDLQSFLKSQPVKLAAKDFKALAGLLGAVRDEDVAIGEYERLASECSDPRIAQGVTSLIEAHRKRRADAFSDLLRELSVDFQQRLRHSFETAMEDVLNELTKNEYASMRSIGRSVIGSLLDELAAHDVGLHDPFDRKTLHQARIATKRLRYAIDLFADCWEDPIKPFSAECARMQGFLGDAHDRDVWIDSLHRIIRSRSRSGESESSEVRAAAWMISEFVKERTKKYREGLKLWAEWRTGGFGLRLREAIAPE